jgi:lipopolysaccharide export system protein LptA
MIRLLSIAAAGALLLGPGAAMAQLARNSDAPVDISADSGEATNSSCATVWRGQAELLQGDTRLRASVLRTYQRAKPGGTAGAGGSACGELDRVEADGPVYYATAKQRARSDRAVYEAASETLTMTGDVVIVQGKNVMRGERVVINTRTGDARFQGEAKGRVRGVFYPDEPAAEKPR